MWYILISFSDGRQGYQAADTAGVVRALVDLNGQPIADDGHLEYRVVDATPPRPAWAGPEPVVTQQSWEPLDV